MRFWPENAIPRRWPNAGMRESKPAPKPSSNRWLATRFDLRTHLYRILGVDLTAVPGLNAITVHTVLAEIGPDLSRFANVAAFTAWLGVSPDNKKSGGQVLSSKTRRTRNRVNRALRIAAQTLHR